MMQCGNVLMIHADGTTECLGDDCYTPDEGHINRFNCSERSHGCPRFECQFGALTPEDFA